MGARPSPRGRNTDESSVLWIMDADAGQCNPEKAFHWLLFFIVQGTCRSRSSASRVNLDRGLFAEQNLLIQLGDERESASMCMHCYM